MTARRLPPFGRQVLAGRRNPRSFIGTSADGRNPTLWLLTGADAWHTARSWANRLAVVAPDDADPADLDWRCLAGADPVLLVRCGEADGNHIARVLAAAFRDGVGRVLDLETGARYLVDDAEAP